jgi:hypothetical protein
MWHNKKRLQQAVSRCIHRRQYHSIPIVENQSKYAAGICLMREELVVDHWSVYGE